MQFMWCVQPRAVCTINSPPGGTALLVAHCQPQNTARGPCAKIRFFSARTVNARADRCGTVAAYCYTPHPNGNYLMRAAFLCTPPLPHKILVRRSCSPSTASLRARNDSPQLRSTSASFCQTPHGVHVLRLAHSHHPAYMSR
jgi:hypothetical protein